MDIITLLANGWRLAENEYLKSGDDGNKWFMKKLQDMANLSPDEKRELESMCNSMGV